MTGYIITCVQRNGIHVHTRHYETQHGEAPTSALAYQRPIDGIVSKQVVFRWNVDAAYHAIGEQRE